MYYLYYKFLCGHEYVFSSLGYIPRSGIPGSYSHLRFQGDASGKEPACQCRRCKRRRFDPRVRKIPWRRAWQPTPVFLPGESHRQRSLAGHSPWGGKESDTTEQLTHTHIHTHTHTHTHTEEERSCWLPLWGVRIQEEDRAL